MSRDISEQSRSVDAYQASTVMVLWPGGQEPRPSFVVQLKGDDGLGAYANGHGQPPGWWRVHPGEEHWTALKRVSEPHRVVLLEYAIAATTFVYVRNRARWWIGGVFVAVVLFSILTPLDGRLAVGGYLLAILVVATCNDWLTSYGLRMQWLADAASRSVWVTMRES